MLKNSPNQASKLAIEAFMNAVINHEDISDPKSLTLQTIKDTVSAIDNEALKVFIKKGITHTDFFRVSLFARGTTNTADIMITLLNSGEHSVVATLIKGDDDKVTHAHLKSFIRSEKASTSTSTSSKTRASSKNSNSSKGSHLEGLTSIKR